MGGMLKRVGIALVLWMVGSAAHAQAAKMYGVVVNEAGEGVPEVKITLDPVQGEAGARVQVASKGKKGAYFFGLVRPGVYTVRVEAPGFALVSLKAKATVTQDNRKEAKWDLDGRVDPAKPPRLKLEDGMDVTCDLLVGKAMETAGAAGAGGAVSVDQAYTLLAQQVQKGDCAGALPQIEAFVGANPTHGHAWYLCGFCQAVLEKNDAAEASLKKAIELEPTFTGSHTLLGKVLNRQGKPDEAAEAFRAELASGKASTEMQVDAWLSLGGVLRDQKKTKDAIEAFQKVIELAPSRPEPYVELSGLYADSGDLAKADAILAQAKQTGADDPAALLHVAITAFNNKDSARAGALCQRIIDGGKAKNPDLAEAYAILGRVQLSGGKVDAGVASLKKSLELDPAGRLAAQTQDILKAMKKN